MPKVLCSTGTFTKKLAVEVPTIANLKYATFFGDGTLNPADGQNLVVGGSTFANVGSGPANHPNYSTISTATNTLSTGMTDQYPAWTQIAAAAPISNLGVMLFGYRNSPPPDQGVYFFNGQIGLIAGLPTFGAGSFTASFAVPVYPAVHLYACVSVVGKPVIIYDLTAGTQSQSSTNVASIPGSRPDPLAVPWEIGATAGLSGFNTGQFNVAFALGAGTELLLTDLNAVAAALRYPLAARGITV